MLGDFCHPLLENGTLRFLDLYILFTPNSPSITDGVERLRQARLQYFGEFAQRAPERVAVIECNNFYATAGESKAVLLYLTKPNFTPERETAVFDTMTQWLATHQPDN